MVGMLSATRLAVLPALLHYRQLQRLVTQSLRKFPSFDAKVSLDVGAKKNLEWWAQNITTWNGQSIHLKPTDVRIETDTSKVDWGAICREAKTGGHWSPQERCLHINCLELQAGAFAIKSFLKDLSNVHVHLKMENQMAVAYINKMGTLICSV